MLEGFGLKWGWYHTFNIIGGGTFEGTKKAQSEKLGEVLYFLAYQSDVVKVNR